jgi:N-acyl-phosphatidylethanolamine-hydrolysing phospholipase D
MSSSSSQGQKLIIRKPDVALSPPAMYQTNPPPHHTSSDASKRSFVSPWPSAGAGSLTPFQFLRIRLFEWEKPEAFLQEIPKVEKCTWIDTKTKEQEGKIAFTWIGHAGCHFRIPIPGSDQFVTVLTDPVLSNRCSPSQIIGPARIQEAPTSVTEMAKSQLANIWPDVLVLSHNHYDHLDYNTIKSFLDNQTNQKPTPHVFCSLGVAQFFYDLGFPKDGVTELDWWQEREISWSSLQDTKKSIKLTCVPAQHFSGRSLSDRNKTVWAGWIFEALANDENKTKGKKVYFAGDSGYRQITREHIQSGKSDDILPYCPAFEEIGHLFGPIDFAAIPIGAYKPRTAMSAIHMNPSEAIQVHKQVRSKQSIGIHWGSFPLAAEGHNEPRITLKEEMQKSGLPIDQFTTMEIGQTQYF